MADATTNRTPEKKYPVLKGSSIAVWLNPSGRAITISPPRYRDEQTGGWRDGSFFPADLPMLIYALQQALDYCYATPVPSQTGEDPFPA